MRFKDIEIGQVFKFASELSLNFYSASGPWEKISARKYRHLYMDLIAQVGTINVNVVTDKQLVYGNIRRRFE